jgi:eukaryotic-like serine/threonine-protein kinase
VAAGVLLLVMGGVFAAAYDRGIRAERDVARQEADRARAALDFVAALFEGADPNVSGGDTLNVFQLLDRGEERLGTHLARRPELRRGMETLLGRLFTQLGDFPRAEALFLSALAGDGTEPPGEPLQAGVIPQGPGDGEVTAEGLAASGGGIALAQNVAQLRYRQGRFVEAEGILARAQERAEAGGDRGTLAGVMVQRGGNLPYTEDASEAEPLLRRALHLLGELPAAPPGLLAEARSRLGTLLMLEGRYPEGEELLSGVVESLRDDTGSGSLPLADALNNLGNLYQRSGRSAEALAAHQEVLTIRRRVLPAGHPDISLSLNNLGTVAAGAGDFQQAAVWMEQAIEATQARTGRENRNVALSIMNLGWIRMRQGELDRSEGHFLESIEIFRRTTGPDSPDTGLALGNLAQLLQLQGRLAEAEAAAVEALRVREAAHGPESMHVAWRSWQVADILEARGRLQEAERYHARSLAVRRIHYPETHPEVTRGRNSLGDLLLRMERWQEAVQLFGAAAAAFAADPEAHQAELEFARGRVEMAEREAASRGIPLAPSPAPPGP